MDLYIFIYRTSDRIQSVPNYQSRLPCLVLHESFHAVVSVEALKVITNCNYRPSLEDLSQIFTDQNLLVDANEK